MSVPESATAPPTQSGLFPGFKHVEAFGPDEDYEEEIEECFVTLDMGSVSQTLVPSSTSYRLIGLDTPTPFMQLSGTIMKGRHQTLLGTELIFKETNEESERPGQDNVQYFTSTERRILFREVELKPKAPPLHPANPDFIPTSTLSNFNEAAKNVDHSSQVLELEEGGRGELNTASPSQDRESGPTGTAVSRSVPLQPESIGHAMDVDE